MSIVWRGASQAEEAHSSADEQEQLHTVYRPKPVEAVKPQEDRDMKLYKFECKVWVRGETAEDALNELHDEMASILQADNNLTAIESDDGVESNDWVENTEGV